MSQLLRLTLIELVNAVRNKKASPVDLMSEVLDRIAKVNGEINAIVVQRDPRELLAEAREAETRIARGEGRLLEGIPLGVKDLEDAAGLPTAFGSKLFRDNFPASDSTQVARLKAAGAIVVGKTNAPEFGSHAVTKNLLYGTTRSPWNKALTPGGSSGGSAAALAAEMLPLVTASDGGGSVRIPASFVGAYGHKPSYGRIPFGPLGFYEYNATYHHGTITKSVEDAALLLDIVSGFDPGDPRSLPKFAGSFLDEARKPMNKLNIAYSPDLGYAVVQSDIAQIVEQAVKVFEELGHNVEKISGGPPESGLFWGLLASYEIGARIAHLRPGCDADVSRGLLQVVDLNAAGFSNQQWAEFSRQRVETINWCAKIFSKYDLLVTPTMPYDPPPAGGPLPRESEGRSLGEIGEAAAMYFTVPFNLTWNPAATVRAGLSKAGFPVGLQIVAPHHRDDLLLRAARAFERERPWSALWPMRQE
jgi:aspartyl-tRNA(Asn)/glutamyl-tRNA(Gln) amidotransferase subunit A